jgi:hypothetical protein
MISQLDHLQLFDIGLTLNNENNCHNGVSYFDNCFNTNNQSGCFKSKE